MNNLDETRVVHLARMTVIKIFNYTFHVLLITN